MRRQRWHFSIDSNRQVPPPQKHSQYTPIHFFFPIGPEPDQRSTADRDTGYMMMNHNLLRVLLVFPLQIKKASLKNKSNN
jgi:hypothetical protein